MIAFKELPLSIEDANQYFLDKIEVFVEITAEYAENDKTSLRSSNKEPHVFVATIFFVNIPVKC